MEALDYMKLPAGVPIQGVKIDVAFIGSCTNGRLSDFREVAKHIKGHKVAPGVKAIVVPGSQIVAIQCEKEGLPQVFRDAGFEWRGAGCSMCLAMNPDKLIGDQLCASSSNRNFKGRRALQRPHRADVSRDGGRRRHHRPYHRRPRTFPYLRGGRPTRPA